MEWGLGCGKDSYRPGQLQEPDEMGRSRQVHPSNLYHSGAATTFSGTDTLHEARNKGGSLQGQEGWILLTPPDQGSYGREPVGKDSDLQF